MGDNFGMENTITEMKEIIKEHEKRILELEKGKNLQEFQYNTIMATLTEITKTINNIRETPSKRWEVLIGSIITAIATSGISYLILK